MIITDEMLMAYADGELDAATREQIAGEIAANSTLAKQVAEHQTMRAQLSGAFDSVLNESVPDRLQTLLASPAKSISHLDVARGAKAEKKNRHAVPFQWMSIAASVVVGMLIGIFAFGNRDNSVIVASTQGLVAKGALARGLTEELASLPTENSTVKIGVSYLAKDGNYCRTFSTSALQGQELAGLACFHADAWGIRMLMHSEQAAGEYRTAGATIPAAILDHVTRDSQAAPLNAEQEAQARDGRWHSVVVSK